MAKINEVLLQALVARVKADTMVIEQVPIPYQEAVMKQLQDEGGEVNVSSQ